MTPLTPAQKRALEWLPSEPAPAIVCQRCQGNGEIVIDWDRYLEPDDGDTGDEAVAECPDCAGIALKAEIFP